MAGHAANKIAQQERDKIRRVFRIMGSFLSFVDWHPNDAVSFCDRKAYSLRLIKSTIDYINYIS